MKRILKYTGITLLLLLITAAAAGTWFIGEEVAKGIIYMNRGIKTRENSVKQLAKWDYEAEVFDSHYVKKQLNVQSEEDYTIPLWLLGKEEITETDTVILVHGLGGDHVSIYPQAEIYIQRGWNVLALDQRGTENSEDEKITFGYYEKEDIKTIVDFIKEKTEKGRIVLHGFSMGGATAGLYGGTKHASENISGIILDSSFDSMKNVFLPVWDQFETGLPAELALWTGDFALKRLFGFNFKDADVVSALEKCSVPVFLIQGEKDEIAPPSMGMKMYSALKENKKELWISPSEHVKTFIDTPEEYEKRVFSFLKKTESPSESL